jgi:hypothetical protein
LLVDQEESKARTRGWLGSIFAASLVGAGVAYWQTGKSERAGTEQQSSMPALPYAFATPDARGARIEAGLLGQF